MFFGGNLHSMAHLLYHSIDMVEHSEKIKCEGKKFAWAHESRNIWINDQLFLWSLHAWGFNDSKQILQFFSFKVASVFFTRCYFSVVLLNFTSSYIMLLPPTAFISLLLSSFYTASLKTSKRNWSIGLAGIVCESSGSPANNGLFKRWKIR